MSLPNFLCLHLPQCNIISSRGAKLTLLELIRVHPNSFNLYNPANYPETEFFMIF